MAPWPADSDRCDASAEHTLRRELIPTLLNILERFGQDDIGFVSLREKHIDTTSAGGRLVLNIMASIAEFERELIAARMAEGRQRAMDNGVKFGPPFKLDAFQKREALARIKAGESQSLIARTYGVDRATISRLQKRAAAS
jgi:DNA invertase Pin-like site-specific DNA recombinase